MLSPKTKPELPLSQPGSQQGTRPDAAAANSWRARAHKVSAKWPVGSRIAARVGFTVVVATVVSTGIAVLVAQYVDLPFWLFGALVTASAAGSASVAAYLVVRNVFSRRLSRLAKFVETSLGPTETEISHDDGDDDAELTDVIAEFDRLLQGVRNKTLGREATESEPSTTNTDATPLIAETTQRSRKSGERRNSDAASLLRIKTGELEQRLQERDVVFDILRESAQHHSVAGVLDMIVHRLAIGLHLRRVLLVFPSETGWEVRASSGLPLGQPQSAAAALAWAPLARARAGEATLVRGLRTLQAPVPLWHTTDVELDDTIMLAPLRFGAQVLGVLVATQPDRSASHETEDNASFLLALAEPCAVAIRNAQLFEALEERATHDELTGLANRRLLSQALLQAFAEAKRYKHPLSVLYLDIDHFKALNDREGHAAGDAALRDVADKMREQLREVDTVARVGGEEFVVLLSRAALADALVVAEKLRVAIERSPCPIYQKQPLGALSISIGVAEWNTQETEHALLERADRALGQAKSTGRNRICAAP